jgi:hypothetical protein
MAEKKKQHTIPKCYLQAWCDPSTPSGQLPFIWRISKDGSSKQKRSPKKSFTATDMYTIELPNGDRNLAIEDTLAKVETDFVAVLSKVRKRQKLDATDRARLCIFSAAMHTRTVSMGRHWKKQMGQLHGIVLNLELSKKLKPDRSLEVAKLVEFAHPDVITGGLQLEAPILFQMQMSILVSDDEFGFITSDRPCVWFNPEAYKLPPFYRAPGLGQEHIEVTLPLTPHHLLFISHTTGAAEYIDADQNMLDETNRLTRAYCDEEFVSWKGETRPKWFDIGEEPDDSWEKSQRSNPPSTDGGEQS